MIKRYSDIEISGYGYKFVIRESKDGSGKILCPEEVEDDYGRTGISFTEIASWDANKKQDIISQANVSCCCVEEMRTKKELAKVLKELSKELEK